MVQFARRDGKKFQVKLADVKTEAIKTLEDFQKDLYDKAAAFLKSNTFLENDYSKFQERIEKESGFYQLHWCGSAACEALVKEETKATIRCIPFDQIKEKGKCIKCGGESSGRVIFARSY
jgi:prolyl-tRNA synthetase